MAVHKVPSSVLGSSRAGENPFQNPGELLSVSVGNTKLDGLMV